MTAADGVAAAVRNSCAVLGRDPSLADLRDTSILITGASGMIGSWLALTLLEADRQQNLNLAVYGLSRNMARSERLYAGLPLRAISRDAAANLGDLPRFDYIVHAASPVGPSLFAEKPFDVAAANLAGTVNLLSKAVRDGSGRFLFISTHEVYGRGLDVWREDAAGGLDFLSPRACYPESKRAAENACVCAQRQHGLHTGIARLSRIYGPGMNLDSGLFVCDFVKDALAGREILIKGDGSLIRPLLYIGDAVSGILRILLRGEAGAAYNVAPSGTATIMDTASLLAGFAGVAVRSAGAGSGGGAIQDTGRLQGLGWEPRINLENGLAATLAALRNPSDTGQSGRA